MSFLIDTMSIPIVNDYDSNSSMISQSQRIESSSISITSSSSSSSSSAMASSGYLTSTVNTLHMIFSALEHVSLAAVVRALELGYLPSDAKTDTSTITSSADMDLAIESSSDRVYSGV